jgi:hypothetical protein
MLSQNSTFVATRLAVHDSALKSLIFRCAEILLAFSVFRIFALLAAMQNQFTPYLILTENYMQKLLYVSSTRFSKKSFFVLLYMVLFATAGLFGPLLWALDAPGFVLRKENVTASSISALLVDEPKHVITYEPSLNDTNVTEAKWVEVLGRELFRPGVNFSLIGMFDQIVPTAPQARQDNAPRIWLDEQGWSISTDDWIHTAVVIGTEDARNQFTCPFVDVDTTELNARVRNCTFPNKWSENLLKEVVGNPMVYWDEETEASRIFTKITPMPRDDPWATLGNGGRSAMRYHIFSVTKGNQRHTFLSKTRISAMNAMNGLVIPLPEIQDLIRKAYTSQQEYLADEPVVRVITSMAMAVQAKNQSYRFSFQSAKDASVQETIFDLLAMDQIQGDTFMRTFRVVAHNITLIRSETINHPPAPFEPGSCGGPFSNAAFGGKIYDMKCALLDEWWHLGPRFLGQTDSSFVFNQFGFFTGTSNTSATAVSPTLLEAILRNDDKLTGLVRARGYLLGIDPGLVTIELIRDKPGLSYLQMFLVALTVVLAGVSWTLSTFCASSHWSSSFLINLLAVTGANGEKKLKEPGYNQRVPDIELKFQDEDVVIVTNDGEFLFHRRNTELEESGSERKVEKLTQHGKC